MSFTSLAFLLFLAATFGLYNFCPIRWRSAFLLVASYAFYCTWSVRAAGALAAATILTYSAGKLVGDTRSPARARIVAALVVCLAAGYLVFLKIAISGQWKGLTLALPLGISYYTFKLISYVLDIYWGKIEPESSLVAFSAYVAFFPQIVAGPIQRPGDFFRQTPLCSGGSRGFPRIVWGLAKKLLIADQLGLAVNYVFGHVHELHGVSLLAGFYLFPIQLYADFSALTDIAIGAGLLFGIESPENFNRPFTASNISGFWRRWHMSLTTWLGDYVFTPLRMATRSAGNVGLALSITVNMVVIGLWHGLAWTYLCFGLIHAVYLIADTLTARGRTRFFKAHPRLNAPSDWFGTLLVFHLTAIAFVFFRAQSMEDAWWLLTHSWAGLSAAGLELSDFAFRVGIRSFVIGLAGAAVLELGERLRPDKWLEGFRETLPDWIRVPAHPAALLYLAYLAVLLLIGSGAGDKAFIYGGF